MEMMKGARANAGQMTVELAVVLPVLIVVAVVATNALQFIGECAAFDREAHDAVRVCATSPAYGQSLDQSCALIERRLKACRSDRGNMRVSVTYSPTGADYCRFEAVLEFSPTLFGRAVKSTVFGVALPRLQHKSVCVVDVYKPGVII